EGGSEKGDPGRKQALRKALPFKAAKKKGLEKATEAGDDHATDQRRQEDVLNLGNERHAGNRDSVLQDGPTEDRKSMREQGAADDQSGIEQAHAQIGAEHEKRAMHQVGDAHEAEDQRKPGRTQQQQTTERQAVDRQSGPSVDEDLPGFHQRLP